MKYHYEYRLTGTTRNGGFINNTYRDYQSAHFDWAYYCGGCAGVRGNARITRFRVYE